jgi:RsiW-degrading membrane proteinase PrsW (M82 family)
MRIALALLPVLLLLGLLVLMDSFKLVPLRGVLRSVAAGALAALLAAALHGALLASWPLPAAAFSRYVAPFTEEALKGLYVALLVRTGRVGFLVDAAIHGFAVGAGFAVVENVEYLGALGGASLFVWIVRGCGTAILHGAATAIFGILTKLLAERHPGAGPLVALPGGLAAVALHATYNHFVLPPLASTALLLAALPPIVVFVFSRSEQATREWMGLGLDTDLELLQSIRSGHVRDSRVGQYLRSLTGRLPGPVVADMLCLLRVRLELAIRAKGLLLAREAGFEAEVGDDVRAGLAELRYLEKAIGPTGLLALKPILRDDGRQLWQLHALAEASGSGVRGSRS